MIEAFVENILSQAWFNKSPSPWSFAFYILMGLIGARILLRRGATYKRWPRLIAFTDALFLLGLIVFLQDTIWLSFNTLKWFGEYGQFMLWNNYWIRFPQNIAGFCLCYLVAYAPLKRGWAKFTDHTFLWMGMLITFTFAVFVAAPSPAWTDYTFAARHQASAVQVFFAFLVSHVGYKVLIGLAFLGLFKIEDSSRKHNNPTDQNTCTPQEED